MIPKELWQREAFGKTELEAMLEFVNSYFNDKRKIRFLKKSPGYFKLVGGINTYCIMLVDNIPPIYRVLQIK